MAMGMAALALTLSGVGAATSAYGTWKQGAAAQRQGEAGHRAADSQAELSDFNAQVADLQADDAVERGADLEARFREQVRGAIGTQRAGFAASNIDVGFGSALDTQADVAVLGELDALTIRTNAAREAWGYKVQAQDFRQRGVIQRREGVMLEEAGGVNRTAARIGAVSTLVGAGGSLLAAKYGFGKV